MLVAYANPDQLCNAGEYPRKGVIPHFLSTKNFYPLKKCRFSFSFSCSQTVALHFIRELQSFLAGWKAQSAPASNPHPASSRDLFHVSFYRQSTSSVLISYHRAKLISCHKLKQSLNQPVPSIGWFANLLYLPVLKGQRWSEHTSWQKFNIIHKWIVMFALRIFSSEEVGIWTSLDKWAASSLLLLAIDIIQKSFILSMASSKDLNLNTH